MECCSKTETPAHRLSKEAELEDDRKIVRWIRIAAGAIIAVNMMAVSLAVNLSELSTGDRFVLESILLVATVIVAALTSSRLLVTAWEQLTALEPRTESLFVVGIAGALGASIFAMMQESGAVYFEVAAILLVIYALGNEVTGSSKRRGLRLATDWLEIAPTCRVRSCCGSESEKPVADVKVGERVVVHPGESVPVDGTVSTGEALLADDHISGESSPAVCRPDDTVYAGSHVVDATIVVTTTRAAGQRVIDEIVASVEASWENPSRLQRQADRLVGWFFPLVAVATIATFVGWTWAAGWQVGLMNSLSVLLVACPCALGFALPLAIWHTLGSAARRGVVATGGEVVEELAAVDTVVLDKTGTLTASGQEVVDFVVRPDLSRSDLRSMVAALEATSEHPLARAFRSWDSGAFRAMTSRIVPARGVEGDVVDASGASHHLFIGRPDESDAVSALRHELRARSGSHELIVRIDGQPAAMAAIDEQLHHRLDATLQKLHDLGLTVIIATGDDEVRARRIGVERVHSRSTPSEKRDLVAELRREGGHVLFVGDGINDAAAMAKANVAMAVGEGTALASRVSSLQWFGRDPTAIPALIEDARNAVDTIRKNLRWAALYNIVGISIASAGLLHPVVAAVLMVGSSLYVTLGTTHSLADPDPDAPSPSLPQVAA